MSLEKPNEKPKRSHFAPNRKGLVPITNSNVEVAVGLEALCADPFALANQYGTSGLSNLFQSRIVVLCTLAACVGGLLFGIDQGLVSIILVMPQFLARFPEIDAAKSSSAGFYKGLLTAMLELGAVFGALQAGFLADKFSRKYTLVAGCAWFIVGSAIQTSSFGLAQLIVGRTVGGVGIGVLSSVAPMYVSEIAPPHMRGRLLVIEQFMIVLGIVIAFYTTYGTKYIANEWSFRLPFLLQMFPGWFLAAAVFFLPFSPRWLAGQGRDDECLQTLCSLRQLPSTDVRIQAEWLTIRAEAAHTREALLVRHPTLQGEDIMSQIKLESASWMDCFKPRIIQRTHIGMGLMFFQQFVGINALIYYSPTLFETLGFDNNLQLSLSGAMNITQLVAVCIPLFFLDKVGRRPWLIGSSAAMTTSHVIVSIMIAKFAYDWAGHQGAAYVGVAFIFTFIFSYGLGWGPLPWAIPAEVHTLSSRAKGVALATVMNWSGNFVIGLITPPLIQKTGFGTFVFFGVFSFLSGVWAYMFVPETAGRTLEQINMVFKNNAAQEDEAQQDEIIAILLGTSDSRDPDILVDERFDKV